MRLIPLLLFSIGGILQIDAQPLYRSLQPDLNFSLYGQRIPGDSLIKREDIVFRADGEKVKPGVAIGTGRSFVRFSTRRSIEQYHDDTLWLEIIYQEQVMRIGFPPRKDPIDRY